VVTHFTKIKSFLHFLPGYFKLKREIIKDIFSIGLSNFLMLITASVVVLIFNLSLKKYGGDFAIGAFGIIGSIGNLIVMIVFGLNQGMQPIAGYNYGARKMSRVLRTFNLTVFAATIVTSTGFVIVQLFPGFITSAFTTDTSLAGIASQGMKLYFIVFPIVGFQVVTSSFFQSIGRAQISILLSLSRQVLFLIPAIIIVPHFLLLKGVWLSAPVADFLSTIVTLFVLRWQLKRLKALEK